MSDIGGFINNRPKLRHLMRRWHACPPESQCRRLADRESVGINL